MSNLQECRITSIVSPNIFWVTKNENDSEVEKLEALLAKNVKLNKSVFGREQIEVGTMVAVEKTERNVKTYSRGVVERISGRMRAFFYHVLLIDRGCYVEVESNKIFTITNVIVKNAEPFAFKVCLYGVLPIQPLSMFDVAWDPSHEDGQYNGFKWGLADRWMPAAENFINKLIKPPTDIYLKPIENRNGNVFGEIHLQEQPGNQLKCLNQILKERQFALWCELPFNKDAASTSSNSLSTNCIRAYDLSEKEEILLKLNDVEKWRNEHVFLRADSSVDGDISSLSSRRMRQRRKSEDHQKTSLLKKNFITSQMSQYSSSGSDVEETGGAPFDCTDSRKINRKVTREEATSSTSAIQSRHEKLLKLANSSRFSISSKSSRSNLDSLKTNNSQDKNEDRRPSASKKVEDEVSSSKRSPCTKERLLELLSRSRTRSSNSDRSASENFGQLSRESDANSSSVYDGANFEARMPLTSSSANVNKPILKKDGLISENEETKIRTNSEQFVPAGRLIDSTEARLKRLEKRRKSTPVEEVDSRLEMSKNSSSTESIELEKPLIFTDELIAGPLNRFKDVRAFSRLLNNLENEGISGTLLKLQRWSVPAIRRGQNVIMIGPKKCGKTISYVVPLVEFVYVRNITDEVSEQGPSALVLCPNSSDAQDVYEICQALLEETSEEEKVRSRFQAMLLLDGSEVSSIKKYKILITTPECLANHDQLGNFDLQGIKYFILDDIDIASTSKRLEVNVVLEKLHFDNSKKSYQTIIASRHYNSLINDLSSRMRGNYVMFISSYLEAAVSVKMKTHIFYNCDINTKSQLLYDKLINVINHRKILIVCQDDEEILHLTDYFKTTGTSPLIVSNDTGFKNCKDVNRSWKCSSSRSQPVLICTDDVFTDLEIEDAHWLVLFSLPSDTDFESRMSCFKKYFKLKNVEDYKEYKELTIIMFLDDSRRHHLVKAVEFGQRLNADLPPKMLQKCKEILHNKRKARKSDQKRDKSLCADILFQGKCSKAGRCLKRHTLDEELDFPKWPKKGRITFTILNVDNPACYWVRPLEHAETEDEDPVPLKSSSLKINLQLMKYYDVIENRTVLSPVKINYWCSVKDEEDVFHRAQVVNFTKLENNRPTEVKVRLTDKGNLMVVKASEIFRIPKRLSERDPQAAQVIIANVAPYSTDKWSPCANPLVRRLTDEDSDVEITGAGRILLSSGNIMWLDDVQILRSTKSKNSRVVESSIRKILLEKEFAVENKFHLPLLKKLCEDANVSAPRNKLLKKLQPVVEPRWESFNEEVEQATLLYAENSSQIFLRQFNNRKRLDELEEKCQKFVQKIKSETELVTSSCSNEKYCLAYSKTSRRWLRARIDSKIGDEIDVFFVDHGESQYIHSNYIVPLPDDLLVQLPFQVIECRLIGVRHEPESNIDIQNEIYNFFDGGRELIYVNVIRENSTAQLTGGKRYDVNLLNLLGKSLNRHLINNKFPREESELSLIKNFKLTSVRDDLD